jgi:hypothetical protein
MMSFELMPIYDQDASRETSGTLNGKLREGCHE